MKNIFSNIETLPNQEGPEPSFSQSFVQTATPDFDPTLVPLDLSTNKQTKTEFQAPPNLDLEDYDESMEDSEEDQEQQTVGDYYDSDKENEKELTPEPDSPHRQGNKTPPAEEPQPSEPRPPVMQQDNSNVAKTSSSGLQSQNIQSQKLVIQSGNVPGPTTPSIQPPPAKGNEIAPKPPGKPGREIAVFKCPLCVKVFCQPPVLDYHLYKFHSGSKYFSNSMIVVACHTLFNVLYNESF